MLFAYLIVIGQCPLEPIVFFPAIILLSEQLVRAAQQFPDFQSPVA